MTSPSTGFLNLSDSEHERYKNRRDGRKHLDAPDDHIIMISVYFFFEPCARYTSVHDRDPQNSNSLLWNGCHGRYTSPYILQSNQVTIHWSTGRCRRGPGCMIINFSFHPSNRVPRKLSSGLYNCSVEDYWRLQQHLDCNMKVECEDERDEAGHCPFSSPACQGWVAYRDKCYKYVSQETMDRSVTNERRIDMKGVKFCASLNASLATFRGRQGADFVLGTLLEVLSMEIRVKPALVDFSFGTLSVPGIYRKNLIASDKTVIYHSFDLEGTYYGNELCFVMKLYPRSFKYGAHSFACVEGMTFYTRELYAICEVSSHDNDQYRNEPIQLFKTPFSYRNGNVRLSRCPDDQMVHMFLSCHPHHACGRSLPYLCTFFNNTKNNIDDVWGTEQGMTSMPVFTCSDDVTRLSYSLVCDSRFHCKDGSDETFCQHPPCGAFACRNGQCVSYRKLCDMVSHCVDDSDELVCEHYGSTTMEVRDTRSPVLISFDGKQSFTVREMSANETCPDTHYRCPGEYNNCLPVYTRCNGWYDCMDHEDEEACEDMTCPGFYRCFHSTVCVHADHLCDGWPHCPQHDDEWLCNMTCPAQCLCQGQIFLCSKPFHAHLFPNLRCLDAQGSKMSPSDLSSNFYIMHLRLSDCSLNFLPTMAFLNLQFLDLAANNITVIKMTAFAHLVNLRTLSLANNPIDLLNYDPNSTVQLTALRTVDLSHSKLTVFDSKPLSNMPNVQSLNLSFSTIHTIHSNGFQYTPRLTHLYLAGNPINMFTADLFKPLAFLRAVSSQSYKFCCREILPAHFELIKCDAPQDEISACEDLLQSGTYRGFLWLISFLALLGNVFCLVVRVCVKRTTSTSGFHVFVTNLGIADLFMGVYLAIVGVADSLFRGEYISHDETWKHSVACEVAGFLSLLSCEVSALTIWLITLDRFIVLHFPFSSVRFRMASAAVACLITWLVGLSLATVPLLPVTSHWEFYSQTGICIPLPVTRQDFHGKTFATSVFVVFNFILFVLIASGQAFIYWSVQQNALTTESSKASRDLTIARRLLSVAVTDFLCWFPIGLCGLLAKADVPIPGEVNVALAIFVLPLNSALNPFMYTFNMLMEKRRKSREALLLQWLENHSDLL